jgi:hypothetical protein
MTHQEASMDKRKNTGGRSDTPRTGSTAAVGAGASEQMGSTPPSATPFAADVSGAGITGGTGRTGGAAPGTSDGGGTRGIAETVKEKAGAQLESQKGRATEGLDAIAQAVRQSTGQLRNDHHETVAQYVDKAAEQLERLSGKLRDKDIGELLDDAQRLARRQPALFIGGSFALGLLAARFLKSSPAHESMGMRRHEGGAY